MEKVSVKVSDKTEMDIYFQAPANGSKNAPGIIVLQEAFGVNSHIQNLVNRFSQAGYFAVAPELYHRTARGFTCGYTDFASAQPHFMAMTSAGLVADTQACYDWLTKEKSVKKVAAVGYCLGGRAAYLANAEVPLSAAISYYGGRIYPDHLPLATKQKSPILFFWGGLDTHIPPEHTQGIARALTEAKKNFTEVLFSQAQHGFSCDERASYNAIASEQAWALTQQYLKNYLQD